MRRTVRLVSITGALCFSFLVFFGPGSKNVVLGVNSNESHLG